MRVSQVKQMFRDLTAEYFASANVIFANQSRAAKTAVPLVTIRADTVHRQRFPSNELIDGVLVFCYHSRLSIEINLFTHGVPVKDDDGKVVGYDDTALDEMMAFADFLSSGYVIEWCFTNDLSVDIDGDVIPMTGVVNDTNYEYRAKITVNVSFTEKAIDKTAVLSEASIKYVSGESEPAQEVSSTGEFRHNDESVFDATIEPEYDETTVCGSKELSEITNGYFTETEITANEGG